MNSSLPPPTPPHTPPHPPPYPLPLPVFSPFSLFSRDQVAGQLTKLQEQADATTAAVDATSASVAAVVVELAKAPRATASEPETTEPANPFEVIQAQVSDISIPTLHMPRHAAIHVCLFLGRREEIQRCFRRRVVSAGTRIGMIRFSSISLGSFAALCCRPLYASLGRVALLPAGPARAPQLLPVRCITRARVGGSCRPLLGTFTATGIYFNFPTILHATSYLPRRSN
jgi:hypothetical protein